MAEGDYNVKAIISAETSRFEKGMKTAQKSLDGVTKSINDVSNLLKTAFSVVGIGVSIKAISDFGKKAVKAADDANRQFKILSNTIKVTGANAWTSTKEMEDMAKEYAKSTNYSVTQIEDMQSVLLGFKNISGETFKEASDAVLDMATVMKMDLTAAVQTVGKALDDPVKGLDSLSRQGFKFSEEEKKMLKTLVETGDRMKAQQIILKELATTYGGAAVAGQTAFAKLQHSMDDFYETVGNKVMPVIQKVEISLSKASEKITDFLKSADFDKLVGIILAVSEKVKAILNNILTYFSNVFTEIKSIVYDVDFSPFISVLDTLIGVIKAFASRVKESFDNVKEEFNALKGALNLSESIDIKKISDTINKVIDIFWYLYDEVWQVVEQLRKIIVDKIIEIWNKIKELYNNSNEALANSESNIKSWGDYFYTIFNNVFQILQDFIGSIRALLEGDWAVAWEYAKLIILRVVSSLITNLETMKNAFKDKMHEILTIASTVARFVPGGQGISAALKTLDNLANKSSEVSNKIETLIKQTEQNITNMTGKAADITIRDLKGISTTSQGTFQKIVDDIKDTADEFAKATRDAQRNFDNLTNNITTDTAEASKKNKKNLKDILKNMGDFGKAGIEIIEELEKKVSDWTSFFKDVFKSFGEVAKLSFESIGEALAGNGEAWDNFGVKVLEIIAQILEALAAQLSALAVTKAMWMSYGEAAAAAGGAAAALIAAGTLKGVAKTMHATSKAVKDCNNNLETFKKLMQEIIKGGVSSGASAINATFAQISKSVSDAEKNLSDLRKEYDDTVRRMDTGDYRNINEWLSLGYKAFILSAEQIPEAEKILENAKTQLNEYLYGENGLVPTSTNAVNDLKMQIESITDLLKMDIKVQGTSSAFKTYLNNLIQKDIIGVFESAYEDLLSIGSNLAQNLISGFTKGLSKKEFMAGLKDYIKQMVVSTALYTEEFTQQIQNVTLSLSQAIVSGNKKGIASAVNSIETLYTNAEGVISNLTSAMDTLFAKYEETADEVTDTSSAITDTFKLNLDSIEELIKSFKENLNTLGSDLTSEFVNGLAEGLNEADFMSKMKDYLRKMVIQTVVYTDTLKNEIAAIGKAISEGIANGFTETGLHEIRRDLSYVFDQANKAIDKVDTMFDTVFSGYATGTQNATKGLHLVGEAGPELVRFRGGEQVLNAGNTQKVLSDTGRTNNFNVTFNNLQDTSAFAMIQQFKDYQRQMAIDGVF